MCNSNFKLEICVDSLQSALIAQKASADRIELCSDLLEGGLTPSYGLIKKVRESLKIDIAVMIRPRGGDFCYSAEEYSVMKEDIKLAKEFGANCVVFGILQPDGHIDTVRTAELVQLALPLEVTFHRAFDLSKDPFRALEDIIKLGINRILTSGQMSSAVLGKELIKELVTKADKRISIMAGSGVNVNNKDILLDYCKVDELHLTARTSQRSKMTYQTKNIALTSISYPDEYELLFADYDIIKKMR